MEEIEKALRSNNKVESLLLDLYNELETEIISEKKQFEAKTQIVFLLENVDNDFIRNLIFANLHHYRNSLTGKINELKPLDFPDLFKKLEYLDLALKNHIEEKNRTTNSEDYYNRKISELQRREEELRKSLTSNLNETEEQRKTAEETEQKLKVIESELNKKKKELELKEKEEDAKNDWEQKIKSTFDNLKEYLNPIEIEHKRLNILYYGYVVLFLLTLILIIICESTLLYRIANSEKLPQLEEYIVLLLPLPIAGALMWGFIFQMNRAQRQLITIANNIHSVKYIQGLLLSINNLSLDINDGITRVNNALDKIISNHLNKGMMNSEVAVIAEEDKDKLELDKMLNIINAIKK